MTQISRSKAAVSVRLALRSCAGFIESKAKVGAASNPLCRRAAAASLRILSEDGVEDGVAGACLNLLSILSNKSELLLFIFFLFRLRDLFLF